MFELRKHQASVDKIAMQIKNGQTHAQWIIALVTPGGGKSLLPMICAQHLIPGIVEKICWIVPRRSLASQAERDWARTKANFGLLKDIRQAGNDIMPSRNGAGYVTTYHSIAYNPVLHQDEFRKTSYLLVLDEPQFLYDENVWGKAIHELNYLSAVTLIMSGTLERGDGTRISCIDYKADNTPDLRDTEDQRVVLYNRTDGIEEGAIVPVEFEHVDAKAEWIDANGERQSRLSFDGATDEDVNAMLYTALNTEYAQQLLRKGVQQWQDFRKKNRWSQLLIVSSDTKSAEMHAKFVREEFGEYIRIATYKDSDRAHDNIEQYSLGKVPALVTVGMAYVGMNAPAITHIICLTRIRSRPWIEQMIGRAVRSYPGKKWAKIIAPDDPPFIDICDQIKNEQYAACRDESEETRNGGIGSGDTELKENNIIAQSSETTVSRISSFDDEIPHLNPGQIAYLEQEFPNESKTKLILAMQQCIQYGYIPSREVDQQGTITTPSNREKNLRKSINDTCKLLDGKLSREPGDTNKEIKRQFGISRGDMTEEQLCQVWRWINKRYGRSL